MAEKFHINTKGEPGKCHAERGRCPFGSEEEHYVTKEGASAAYERSMHGDTIPKLEKAPTRSQVEQVLDAMSRGEDTIPEGVEFVERRKDYPAAPKPQVVPERVAALHSSIQKEIEWCLEEEKIAKSHIKSALLATAHVADHFGEESEAWDRSIDSENAAFQKLRELEQYRYSLEEDNQNLIDPQLGSGRKITELRETLREKRLKRELHNLLYESYDGKPSLRTLEEKATRPIRREEDYHNYLKAGGKPLSDSDLRSSISKHEQHRVIQGLLDDEAKKRRATELPERTAQRNAEVDAAVNKNVALFAEDEENLKSYNSFGNRARRLFSAKKNVLSERDRLNALPSGRKLIDYGQTGEKPVVWTKISENSWVDGYGNFSSDNDRKLPAVIVD
jgi:hypothetical protein